ncbi:similar to Saccharomyces cerevisiae YNR056C BIO5 Putative transmembrane protein involved in the biotin biosynthesis pathway [Maudiozyma saulgeensis]|uniref:Similar to Saccharomyces cerevisiae YNR056C BIO5 Putative transmembrane protein involved in the biotin biosynthesis pathway n=1 Tax=Maudiozyma saulgeensis TaxID=1789683 RepID=A0A1X7R9R9_9SACH|nr:similar to Saccharomyces cerevisiae YNR056C BIO5 Putative transmembrane protein involved in the biotin biosynthesis pathway [Kazachstania saulgeensis]
MDKKQISAISIAEIKIVENNSLEKNFKWQSLLGIAFSLTNSWLGISSSLSVGISSGGPMLIIYGLVIGFFFSLICSFTLSSFARLLPNSNGPCFWVLKLCERSSDLISEQSTLETDSENITSKDKNIAAQYSVENLKLTSHMQRNLGLITGLLNYFGAVFTTASICSSLSLNILGMYAASHPTYELKKWHTFIAYQCLNILVLMGNLWSKPLPSFLKCGLYLSIFTFFLTFLISLISRSNNNSHQWPSSSSIFADFDNNTGWRSSGVAFIVGLINPLWAFVGIDSATHMTDEVGNDKARVLVSRVIFTTVILGFLTSFVYSIGMFYCITDKARVQTSILPILEIYQQATDNRNLSIFMQSLCALCGIICGVASSTWQSRILWSVARDFRQIDRRLGKNLTSKIFSLIVNVHPKLQTPLIALLLSHCLIVIIGCIFMGSTTAFNAIITASITLLLITYAIPSFILLIKRSTFYSDILNDMSGVELDITIHKSIGWFQFLAHSLCILWALFCLCFFSLPYELPVTANSMNYVSVVYGAVALIILLLVQF